MRLLQGIEKRFAEQKRNTTVSKSIIWVWKDILKA
jgi:hypothetical protein